MLDQIIYTSCCYGLDLLTGEKTQRSYGLKVYSYSEALRKSYSPEELVSLEKFLSSCTLWDDSPKTPARAYCYRVMPDGRNIFMKARIANVTEGRGFYLSQAFLGKFSLPPAFSIDGSEWVTDEQLTDTEGMSDQVYQVKHGSTNDAPTPIFLEQPESLKVHYGMRDVGKIISSVDVDKILKCLSWLLTDMNEKKMLIVRFQPKVDRPDEEFYADRVSYASKEDAQLLAEYVCWLISYVLPAHSALSLSFSVGIDALHVAESGKHYRILFIPVREDNDIKGGNSYDSGNAEGIKRLVQSGEADTLSWDSGEASFSVNQSVIGNPYFMWVKDALNGDISSLRDFKNFCSDELSYSAVNEELLELALVFEHIKSGSIGRVSRDILKKRFIMLAKYDEEYNYEDTLSGWVRGIYSGYNDIAVKDALKGFPVLKEMYGYYGMYNSLPEDDYVMPLMKLIDSLMTSGDSSAKDVFEQIFSLESSCPGLYSILAEYVVSNASRYAEEMRNGSPANIVARWNFITRVLNSRNFSPENSLRVLIDKVAVLVFFSFSYDVSKILKIHSSDGKEHFLEFLHLCAEEMNDDAREKLYMVAIEIFARKNALPDKAVFAGLMNDTPRIALTVLKSWLKINAEATISIAFSQLPREDAGKWLADVVPYASSEVMSVILMDFSEYGRIARDIFRERVKRERYSAYDKELLTIYVEDYRKNELLVEGKAKGIYLCSVLEDSVDIDDMKSKLASVPQLMLDARNLVSKFPALSTRNCCRDIQDLKELLAILVNQFAKKLSAEIKARTGFLRSKKNPEEAAYSLLNIYSGLVLEDTENTSYSECLRSYSRALLEALHSTCAGSAEAFVMMKIILRKVLHSEDYSNKILYDELSCLLADSEVYSKNEFVRLFRQMEANAEDDERLVKCLSSLKEEVSTIRDLTLDKRKGFSARFSGIIGRIMGKTPED